MKITAVYHLQILGKPYDLAKKKKAAVNLLTAAFDNQALFVLFNFFQIIRVITIWS